MQRQAAYRSREVDEARLIAVEAQAKGASRKVLEAGRALTVHEQAILPGSCWDYANAVYNRAGIKDKKRSIAFKGTKKGPYAPADLILPGDWLHMVNLERNIEHSVIFVDWIDRSAMEGYVLSYAGEKRQVPARYRSYDLSKVYRIVRPVD